MGNPKVTIDISITVDDLGDLERVEQAVRFLTAATDGAYGGEQPAKKTTGKKINRKAAKPDVSEEALLGDDDSAPQEVTEDDIKTAVREKIESDSVAVVKEIFAKFKATKLSEIKADRYPELLAALQE